MLTLDPPVTAPPAAIGRRPHAAVIGSGFGGLAAAIRLAVRGYRVTVLEKLDAPGGRAYVFRQDGFTFDAGPTVITAPFLLEDLWRLCGRRLADDVELRPVTPFYRIRFDDGSMFDYTGDEDAMRGEIERFSPDDIDGYSKFMAKSRKVCQIAFEELAHQPFTHWTDMAKVMPALTRLGAYRSVYGEVSRFIKDPRLRQVFSFHPLLIGGNPLRTSAMITLIFDMERKWGVHFAMGGTGALINGMVNLLEGQGGRMRYNAPVSQITVENGRATGVELEDGSRLTADIVVSNADSAWTYANLVKGTKRRHWSDRVLKRARYSMSLFLWYFGTNRRYENVAHHSILLGPRYQELLKDIFDRKILADDFSLYLHRPTATDPSLAPPGHDGFYVLAPVPHLESGVDWHTMAEPYRKKIERYLEATVLPGLSDALVTSKVQTPLDFRDRLNGIHGAAFSLEPIIIQSAYFRPHNRSEDIENLFLVGAGTHPGAGVPGVLSSARVVDQLVPSPHVFA